MVGPGRSPLTHEAWPGHVAQSLPGPGEWALVNRQALTALPDELASRLEAPSLPVAEEEPLYALVLSVDGTVEREPAPVARDDLYEACRRHALLALSTRIDDPVVAGEPRSSGLLLARVRIDAGQVLLDLAPSTDENGAPGLGVALGGDALAIGAAGPGAEPSEVAALALDEAEVDFGYTDVALPWAPAAVRLPSATLAWPLPEGLATAPGEDLVGRLDVAVPELHLAPLLAHLGLGPAEQPVFRMRLAAGEGEASPR